MTSLLFLTAIAAAPSPAAPLPPEVQAIVDRLDAGTDEARLEAIHKLRMLARRADYFGGQRIRRGEPFEPKVPGLLPHLIRATGDAAEMNRMTALIAVADTLDPAAPAALRAKLKDKSDKVRFMAACLLTEFQDAAGMDEMKKALARFREDPKSPGPFDTEKLLASFERITGKSFGPIPANPFISSDSRVAEASTQRYKEMLDTWAAWWEWKPGK